MPPVPARPTNAPPDGPAPATARSLRIARKPLHEEVTGRIRDMIVEGHLKPGERINEAVLAAAIGVSRTPIREALKLLASEGLILLLPNRSARVTTLSAKEVGELFELISGIERLAAELAAVRMTAGELARLERSHRSMEEHFQAGNRHHYFRLNQDIHRMLVGFARNAIMKTTHEALIARARRSRYLAILSPERWREAMTEHEELLAALKARDAALAGEIMRRHTSRTGEIATAALAA